MLQLIRESPTDSPVQSLLLPFPAIQYIKSPQILKMKGAYPCLQQITIRLKRQYESGNTRLLHSKEFANKVGILNSRPSIPTITTWWPGDERYLLLSRDLNVKSIRCMEIVEWILKIHCRSIFQLLY